MGKKLQDKEFERIIAELPTRERNKLREQTIDPDWLRAQLAECSRSMRRDTWVGPIWLVVYAACLFWRGFDAITIAVFAVGALYFGWSLFTTGSYGTNRRRVKVYQALLTAMGEQL